MRLLYALAAATVLSATASAQEEQVGPDLLTAERIARLPRANRAGWDVYVIRSKRLHAADSASLRAELSLLGRSVPLKAPYSAPDFEFGARPTTWFSTDSAQQLAQSVLSWQTRSGGWSKRTDMRQPRAAGMSFYSESESWHYTPTFDNGATTGQLRFLAEMVDATGMPAYAKAFNRGLELILAAQQPSGCWPQTYPLEGGYHDAATFNDDSMVRLLRLLDDVANARWAFVSREQALRAKNAAARGVACIVRAQVVVRGRRAVWGQQHDPITLEVVPARKYELAGLAGRESASIMMYLMSIPQPSAHVKHAVHAAAGWFQQHAMRGYRYESYTLTRDDTASEIWPRLTEIGTDRAIFANRDGVKLYDWSQLTDRRSGYAWYGTEPAAALARYAQWKTMQERKK